MATAGGEGGFTEIRTAAIRCKREASRQVNESAFGLRPTVHGSRFLSPLPFSSPFPSNCRVRNSDGCSALGAALRIYEISI